jgi:hypothetical protein
MEPINITISGLTRSANTALAIAFRKFLLDNFVNSSIKDGSIQIDENNGITEKYNNDMYKELYMSCYNQQNTNIADLIGDSKIVIQTRIAADAYTLKEKVTENPEVEIDENFQSLIDHCKR